MLVPASRSGSLNAHRTRHVSAFPGGAADPWRYFVGVASWDADAKTTHPVDFRLVHNTFVTMFCRSSLLGETVGWLRSHGYEVAEFDAGSWASVGDMLNDLAERLQFPCYFGRNLDALNDCMRDVASGEYGWHAGATGLVIVLSAFDTFRNRRSNNRSDHAQHRR